jgi:hypothetical protein
MEVRSRGAIIPLREAEAERLRVCQELVILLVPLVPLVYLVPLAPLPPCPILAAPK